jgi:hypothetical protein
VTLDSAQDFSCGTICRFHSRSSIRASSEFPVRRFVSISLLLLLTLPLVSPLFAASMAEANVPVCCRRNGKHHCTMAAVAQQSSSTSSKVKTAAVRERCPYNPSSSAAVNLVFFADPIQQAIFAGIVSHPACHAQTEACFRISFDRSRQKRGPPALILSLS